MDYNPDLYNKINRIQEEDAKKLIKWISNDYLKRETGIIVDVGSGCGKITTTVLAASIKHTKLLGIDSDPNMVEFCTINYSIPNADYCVGDISNNWDLLDEKIKNLEGNVNLIFSNFVLHWIPKQRRDNACSNIFRLLKPGGRFYFNIALPKPICAEGVSPADKELLRSYYDMLPIESQVSKWKTNFENAGFVNVKINVVHIRRECDSSEEYLGMLKLFFKWYKRFLPVSNDQGVDVQELHDKVQDIVFRAYSVKSGDPLDEHFNPSKCMLNLEHCFGKGEKSNH